MNTHTDRKQVSGSVSDCAVRRGFVCTRSSKWQRQQQQQQPAPVQKHEHEHEHELALYRKLLTAVPVMRMAVPVLLIMILMPAAAFAQFISFSVSTQPRSAVITAAPIALDLSIAQELRARRGAAGGAEGLSDGVCIAIGAPENIPVLVSVSIEDEYLPAGQSRPFTLEKGYINDRGACPADTEMARRIYRPFAAGESVSFTLSSEPLTRRSTANGRNLFFTAYIFLNTTLLYDMMAGTAAASASADAAARATEAEALIPTATGAGARRHIMRYQGRYVLDITYL